MFVAARQRKEHTKTITLRNRGIHGLPYLLLSNINVRCKVNPYGSLAQMRPLWMNHITPTGLRLPWIPAAESTGQNIGFQSAPFYKVLTAFHLENVHRPPNSTAFLPPEVLPGLSQDS